MVERTSSGPDAEPTGFEFPPPIEGAVAAPTASREAARPVSFPPMGNPHVVGVTAAALLDDIDLYDQLDRADAEAVAEVARRMAVAVTQANVAYYRFHLTDIHENDEPSTVTIEDGGSWPGLNADQSTRKLTLVLPLEISSPTGDATLQMPTLGKEMPIERGTLLMFPAFLDARVVTGDGGFVRALVSHSHGSAFS